ncbi:hypothetical protein BY458DRAFT_491669 [Sporodiniella umbellata]|nr:hypothetical protein BY458DRAFT_491669 [Sporodiniella umbellata]
MWDTNKGLTSSHPYDSRPESWPFLRRGINFWSQDKFHLYLLGNPLVYWSASLSVLAYLVMKCSAVLLEKRDLGNFKDFKTYDESAGFFLVGWFFHYIPFFLMGRQLFLHHYMPALYFSILLFAVGFDLLISRWIHNRRVLITSVWILMIIYVYRTFLPITYGEPWTQALCEKAKWRSTWDFDCAQFHHDIESYQVPKPFYMEGLDKAKNAVSSYLARDPLEANRAKVAGVVNIVSDGLGQGPSDTILNNTATQ